jgi:hypothetical protein
VFGLCRHVSCQQKAVALAGEDRDLGRSKPYLKLVRHTWIASAGDHVATDTEMEVPMKKFSQRSGWWEAELARQVYNLDGAITRIDSCDAIEAIL